MHGVDVSDNGVSVRVDGELIGFWSFEEWSQEPDIVFDMVVEVCRFFSIEYSISKIGSLDEIGSVLEYGGGFFEEVEERFEVDKVGFGDSSRDVNIFADRVVIDSDDFYRSYDRELWVDDPEIVFDLVNDIVSVFSPKH